MKNIWQQLNRPLVVLLVGLALWPVVSAWRERLAVHASADAIFQELNHAEDQMNAQAKKSGIKKLVETFVSQFVDGFTAAMEKAGAGQESRNNTFASTLEKVSVSEVKTVPSNFGGREKIIGIIHNDSPLPVSDVHLNVTLFDAGGHLLDVLDENLSDVKLLRSGQAVGFSVDHDLSVPGQDEDAHDAGQDEEGDDASRGNPATAAARKAAADARKAAESAKKAAQDARKAARVTVQVVSFSVETPKEPAAK